MSTPPSEAKQPYSATFPYQKLDSPIKISVDDGESKITANYCESTSAAIDASIVPFPPTINSTHLLGNSEIDEEESAEDKRFFDAVKEVELAISQGFHPMRIHQGSSGSYFCRDRSGKILGVFKPKNEEPYGKLNPKWTKWFHRTCCPWCFGRSCLIPNLGYISEAAASTVDTFLGLGIVPKTKIIQLASPSFYYDWIDLKAYKKTGKLPLKIGSFQLFVEDYVDAGIALKNNIYPTSNPSIEYQFQRWFERLVILDYIIRNTDRGMDNWMVYLSNSNSSNSNCNSINELSFTAPSVNAIDDESVSVSTKLSENRPILKIAGIDNGLAFPLKHPDEWRSYPYGWLSLPIVKTPFSIETRIVFLPFLKDPSHWDSLVSKLREIFIIDADFDERSFRSQMAVLRGQLHNLVEELEDENGSPYTLCQKPLIKIEEEEDYFVARPAHHSEAFPSDAMRRKLKTFVKANPWFSCF